MQRLIIYTLMIFCICLSSSGIGYAQQVENSMGEPPDQAAPVSEDEFPVVDDFPLEEDFAIDDEMLSSEEESVDDSFPLTTEVNLTFTGVGRLINDDSRMNPDNTIQDLEEGEVSFEADLTVSDYLNEQQTLRWLFKSYSFYSSEKDVNDERINTTRIDELFADWKLGSHFISLGKRRINWGHAMAFNPANVVVPPRDPLNPNQETEGQPVAWLSLSQDFGSLDLFFTRDFDKDWNSDLNRWGARLGVYVGEFDFSLYYFDSEPYDDERDYERMYGVSFSTNLTAGMTLYSEIAGFEHNYRNYYDSSGTGKLNDEFYVQGVIGSYIILDPESFLSFLNGDASLTLEAYYDGGGYSESERKNYFDTLDQGLQEGDPSVLGDYRFTGMSHYYLLFTYRNSFKERYTTELSGLISQDASFSVQSQLTYNLSDYYSLTAKLTHNQGGDDTEFGNASISDAFEISIDINF